MDETLNQAAGDQALATHPPLPPPNMEDIQEQLRKMERMYQKACREARLSELRAEHAESLLETKQGILEGSAQQAEYERLMNESEQAKRDAKDSKKKCEALEQEMAALKEEVIDERRKKEDALRDKEKLDQVIVSLKASTHEANSQLAILQRQLQQQQGTHTVQDRILGPAREEPILAEVPAPIVTSNDAVATVSATRKRREENSRNPSSVVPSHSAQPSTDKSAIASYREIKDNRYSEGAKRLVLVHFSHFMGAYAEMPKFLDVRNNPKARSVIVEPNIYGLVATQEVARGDYIAELLGYVCRPEECTNRDLVPGSMNDHTFLLGDLFVVDARKCGNFARNLRRSCKPNAELISRNIGDKLYIMIKAIDAVAIDDEVSIKLEDDWKEKPRPAQGCACKDKGTCELERFFNQKKMEGLWENDMETVENAKNKAGSVTISDKGKIVLDDCHKDLVVRMSSLFSHGFKVDGLDRIHLLYQCLTPAINVIDGAAKSAVDLSENEARVIALKMHIAMRIIHSFYTHEMVEGKETEDFRLYVDEWVEKVFAILHRTRCRTLVMATTSPSFEQTGLHLAIRAMKEWNEVVQPLALADLKTTSEQESPMKKRKKE